MTSQLTDEEVLEEARKRVEVKRKFYKDLMAYLVINAVLIVVWAFPAGRGHPWFLYPLVGWGAFVLLDYIKIFLLPQKDDKAAIEREMEKIRRGQ